MVLAMVLVGVVGAFAIFYMPSLSKSQLDVAANQVASDITYAQQNAMTTGTTSGVNFVSGGAYTVYQGTTATPLVSPLTHQNMVTTLSARYPGVSITNSYTVEFNNFGSPTTGGGGGVTISSNGQTHTISVTANTGLVTIQ